MERRDLSAGRPAPVVERRRGRPRVDVPRSSVSTWMPVDYHDRLIALAARHEVSVSALVRRVLIFQLDKPAQ